MMVRTKMGSITTRRIRIHIRGFLVAGMMMTLGLLLSPGTLLSTTGLVSGQESTTKIDVQHYSIDAQLVPAEQILRARANVVFVPAGDTRSAVFELNGSLTVTRISRLATSGDTNLATPVASGASGPRSGQAKANPKPQSGSTAKPTDKAPQSAPAAPLPAGAAELQFIQDNRENMNVRVDLGAVMPAGKPVTLRFEYEGVLETAQGGPIQNARLAFVGDQGCYLFYAARWFPFHEYAADRATYDMRITAPAGFTVVGYSETPVSPVASTDDKTKAQLQTFSFTSKTPVLPGNFAAAKYQTTSKTVGAFSIDTYYKSGNEQWAAHAADLVGKRLEFFSSKFGPYAYGHHFIIAETDEETLPAYSGSGTMFLSPRAVTEGFDETVARETAFQWWGQTVGIKSFDDIWLVQGLAEFSSLLFIRDSGTNRGFNRRCALSSSVRWHLSNQLQFATRRNSSTIRRPRIARLWFIRARSFSICFVDFSATRNSTR